MIMGLVVFLSLVVLAQGGVIFFLLKEQRSLKRLVTVGPQTPSPWVGETVGVRTLSAPEEHIPHKVRYQRILE